MYQNKFPNQRKLLHYGNKYPSNVQLLRFTLMLTSNVCEVLIITSEKTHQLGEVQVTHGKYAVKDVTQFRCESAKLHFCVVGAEQTMNLHDRKAGTTLRVGMDVFHLTM